MTKENRTFPSVFSETYEEDNPHSHHVAPNNILIAIGCLTFFPLAYLVGRTIVQWAG